MSLRIILVVGLIISASSNTEAQSLLDPRFLVTTNLGIQAQSTPRTDIVNFEYGDELGEIRSTQTLGPYVSFDIGGSMRVWKQIGVGMSLARTQGTATAMVEADVPHPMFYEWHRTARTSKAGLTHRELGYHIYGQLLLPISSSTLITVSGGPSYFNASQEVVVAVESIERNPPWFETVRIIPSNIENVATSAWGYNAGVDLTYYRNTLFGNLGLSGRRRIGVGVDMRYSWAKPPVALKGQLQDRGLQVGVVRVTGGIRIRF